MHAKGMVDAPGAKNHQPGKSTLVPGHEFGVDHIDNGMACKSGERDPGCFLTVEQRNGVFNELTLLVSMASTNFKLALTELKTRELVKRDDDLHWALALVLDLASFHLTAIMSTALKAVKTRSLEKLENMILSAGVSGAYDNKSWYSRAERLLASATTTRIDTAVRLGFVPGTATAKKVAQKEQNAATQTKKEAAISYLDHLGSKCDAAFLAFFREVRAHAKDAELVVAWEGLQPQYHEPSLYRDALGAKLDRFNHSGVLDIGRKQVDAGDYGQTSIRDTRVVYVQDIFGNKVPWFQCVDGDQYPGHVKAGDPLQQEIGLMTPEHKKSWSTFGARGSSEATLDRRVPDEFRESAIAYSEVRWGSTPTIDDGYVATLRERGVDVDEMRMRLRGSPLVKSSSIFPHDRTPWDTRPVQALPQGSVFEEKTRVESTLPAGSIFSVGDKKP